MKRQQLRRIRVIIMRYMYKYIRIYVKRKWEVSSVRVVHIRGSRYTYIYRVSSKSVVKVRRWRHTSPQL